MKIDGKTAIVAIVLAFVAWTPVIQPFLQTAGLLSVTGAGTSTGGVISGGQICPNTLATNIVVRVKNMLNASEDYNLGTPTGYVFGTNAQGQYKEVSAVRAATTGATGKSYAVTCGRTYDMFILPVNNVIGAGVNSIKLANVQASGVSVDYDINAYQAGYPLCKIFDADTNSNLTAASDVTNTGGWEPCSSAAAVVVTTAAQTFGLGTSKTYHLQFQTNSSGTLGSFGSNDPALKTYLCFDFSTGKLSKANGVVVGGLTEVSAPAGAVNDGYNDKCYAIAPITSNDPVRDYAVSLKADLADPTSSDDVSYRLYDEQWYIGNDGLPKIGTVDDSSSDVGLYNVGGQIAMG